MWNRLFGGAGWKDEAVSAGILWNAAAADDCYEIGSLCLDWVTVFHYFATFLIRQIRGRTVLAARGKTVMICPGRRVRAARGAAAGGPVTRTHSRPLMLHSLRCLSWLFKVSRVVLLSCVMALSLNLNTAHTTIKQTSKCLTELRIWKLRYNITFICFFSSLFLFQHEEESLGMERQLTDLVISSLESLSLERRMVQFWARLLSITEMILCRRPIVPISRRSSIEPSTLWNADLESVFVWNFILGR